MSGPPRDPEQLPLFTAGPDQQADQAAGDAAPALNAETPLHEALQIYYEALRFGGASPYTIKAFRSDLGLLAKHVGPSKPVGRFGTSDLNEFLHWMQHERGKPCSPKTYARRVTALKNFFGYLYSMEAIPRDPSNAVLQRSVESPLPDVLAPGEVSRILRVTSDARTRLKPDARPHLLVTLLLETGIKKSECMSLRLSDIDRAHPEGSYLHIRYSNPQMRYKERKVAVPPDWLKALDEYVVQRKVRDIIFDCTARNLEYVLRDVAIAAGLPPTRVSFETLRWTCALKDYVEGMDPDRLRQKLGISRVTWAKTSEKLAELARSQEPPH